MHRPEYRLNRAHKIPYMSGMGGNIVAMLPNGLTGSRIFNRGGSRAGMAAFGDVVTPFSVR